MLLLNWLHLCSRYLYGRADQNRTTRSAGLYKYCCCLLACLLPFFAVAGESTLELFEVVVRWGMYGKAGNIGKLKDALCPFLLCLLVQVVLGVSHSRWWCLGLGLVVVVGRERVWKRSGLLVFCVQRPRNSSMSACAPVSTFSSISWVPRLISGSSSVENE